MIISNFILIVIILIAWIMGVVVGALGTKILKTIFGDPIHYVEDETPQQEYERETRELYKRINEK